MIRKAEKEDIAAVSASYHELFAYEAEHGSTTNWADGVYPTADTAERSLNANSLYVLESDGTLCGSMILNQFQPNEYRQISWQYPA